jgi:hypothetical protein
VDELQTKNEKLAGRVPSSKARLPHLKAPQKGQIGEWMASVASLTKEKADVAIRAAAHASMHGT